MLATIWQHLPGDNGLALAIRNGERMILPPDQERRLFVDWLEERHSHHSHDE
jgi:hypothetical protein